MNFQDYKSLGVHWLSQATRSVLRKGIELRARLTGKRFSCAALSGESNYNVSINGDLTVSCNCNDRDGAGYLGNLQVDSFEDIFRGEIAQRFRKTLASGRLPITHCVNCYELQRVSREEVRDGGVPCRLPHRGLMVENTSLCNLACTSCSRIAYDWTRKGKAISPEQFAKVTGVLQRLGIEEVHYYKLNEPFLSPRILEEMQSLRQACPDLRIFTSTNGMAVRGSRQVAAALMMNSLIFSIDGITTPMCRRYQGGQNFETAFANMSQLVETRNRSGQHLPVIFWKYVLFRWNRASRHLEKAIELARQASVDYLLLTPATSPPTTVLWHALVPGHYRRLGRSTIAGRLIRIAATPEHDRFLVEHMPLYTPAEADG